MNGGKMMCRKDEVFAMNDERIKAETYKEYADHTACGVQMGGHDKAVYK
jgi:hypothetical protein